MIAILVLIIMAIVIFRHRPKPIVFYDDTPVLNITIQIKGDVHVQTDLRTLSRG